MLNINSMFDVVIVEGGIPMINYIVNYFSNLTELQQVSWVSLVMFNVALGPDMYKIIKDKLCVGASYFSNVVFIIALLTGFYSNWGHGNYIFCINDTISLILQSIMLYLKFKYKQ